MQIFLQDYAFNSSKYTLRSGSVGSHGTSIFVKEFLYSFSIVAYQFTFPPAVHKDSLTPQLHQHLLHLVFFMKSIPIGARWYLIVVLICIPWWLEMLSIFSCTSSPFICLLGENAYSVSPSIFSSFFFYSIHFLIGLFVLLLLNCISSVCIFDINPIWDTWFTNIISFPRLPFHFVHCCFAVKKLFSLMQSHLLIFAIIAYASGVISKRNNGQEQCETAHVIFS